MNRISDRAPGSWRVAMVIAVALIVAACGSNPPPSAAPATESPSPSVAATASPSPSPSPTASPSPSNDVGAALIGKLTGPGFFAKSTIAGELDVAGARYGIVGSYDAAGVANHTVLTVQTPTGQAEETIYSGGTTYHRTGSGPWYAKPPTLGSSDVSGFLRTVKTIQDSGVEAKNGQQLHHLTLPPGTSLPPSALGLTDPSITGATGTLEFWAKDDGTPAVMTEKASWQQTVSGSPVDAAMTVEFTFTDVGTVFTIDPPAQVWTTYTSAINHLSIGYPTDWDLFKSKKTGKFDEFDGPIYAYSTVGRYAAKGVNLNALVRYFAAHKPSYVSKYHVDKITTTKMNGVSARQLLIHATYKGVKEYWVVVLALKGTYFYELDFIDKAGHEADSNAQANLFLSTLVLK